MVGKMLKPSVAALLAGVLLLGSPGQAAYAAVATTVNRGSGGSQTGPVVPVGTGVAQGLLPGYSASLALPGGSSLPSLSPLPALGLRAAQGPDAAVLPSAPAEVPGTVASLGSPAPAVVPLRAGVIGAARAPPGQGLVRVPAEPKGLPPVDQAQGVRVDKVRDRQAEVSTALSRDISVEGARDVAALVFEGRGVAAPAEGAAAFESQESAAGSAATRLAQPDRSSKSAPTALLAGKTLLYVVSKVGGRDYLYDHMLSLARDYGFDLLVLGYPDQKDFAVSRGVKPENYVAADIGNRFPGNVAAIVAQVAGLARTRRIDAVKTYLNSFALLEAELSHALGLPGYDPRAVADAHSKSRARELMNAHPDAGLHLPAILVDSEAAAREAFLKIKAAGWASAVAKPDSGGGGWGVTLNIDSPEAAAAAFRDITEQIEKINQEDPRKSRSKQLDQKPPVLFEAQIPDGLMLDAEVIVQGGVPVFTFLSYNPPALGNQERGTTYPAALTPEMAELAKGQAAKALEAVGLRTGNAHVELIVTLVNGKLAAPIVEINARMGGADVWASVAEASGVDVMREGMLAAFAVESRPQAASKPFILQHRFMIARSAGSVVAVRGLPEAGGEIFLSELFLKVGDTVKEHDLLGNITIRGADEASSRERLFALLQGVEIDIETPDGRVTTQTGLFGHDTSEGKLLAADWVDRIDFGRAGWLGRIRLLPKSFLLGFTPAWTLNAMAQEVQAVALPLFSAALFGLPAALIVTGVGYVMRVTGAWLGSFFMARFNPKWVNVAALVLLALAGLPIPIAAALGASSGVIFGMFLANAVVQGLVYGINRGVAENLLPRMIIGNHNPAKLELGLNFAYQWVEIACIGMALFVAVPLLNLVGGNAMMVVSSVGIGLSTLLYATLKYREGWAKPAREGAAAKPAGAPKAEAGAPALGLKDYLPYAFFRFMHFMLYGVLATVFALSVFSSKEAAGTMIGVYDGGSWLASGLATVALLPEKMLGRTGWTVVGGLAAVAFVWSALLHVPLLTFVLGGVLGGVITINSNKWMAYYSQSLPQDKYRNLSKWMMTASVAAMLPIFAAVSLARIFPAVGAALTMSNILLGVNVLVTVAAAAMMLLLLRRK
ncbi:MAG: hypothetical protein HY927_08365 [Elusimicrobia bacterium]|nr:hypothetical protein [Elusimicrobiota bacterium]